MTNCARPWLAQCAVVWYRQKWGITCLSFGDDPEPFGKVRDHNVRKMAQEYNVEVISHTCHTLYDVNTYVTPPPGQAPAVHNSALAMRWYS